jgi:hypothetical protein
LGDLTFSDEEVEKIHKEVIVGDVTEIYGA